MEKIRKEEEKEMIKDCKFYQDGDCLNDRSYGFCPFHPEEDEEQCDLFEERLKIQEEV